MQNQVEVPFSNTSHKVVHQSNTPYSNVPLYQTNVIQAPSSQLYCSTSTSPTQLSTYQHHTTTHHTTHPTTTTTRTSYLSNIRRSYDVYYPVGTAEILVDLINIFPKVNIQRLLDLLQDHDSLLTVKDTSRSSIFQSIRYAVFDDLIKLHVHQQPTSISTETSFLSFSEFLKSSNDKVPLTAISSEDDPAIEVECSPEGTYEAASGRKKALIVGVNYSGTENSLQGCIADALRVKQFLISMYGFKDNEESMLLLTDEDNQYMPTRENIIKGMKWLADGAERGDVLYFHFSGHGSRKLNTDGNEDNGYDETILPCDFDKTDQILDDEINSYLVRPLPNGVRLQGVLDCCHSGTGADLAFNFNCITREWALESSPHFAAADVCFLSGCRSDQTAADVQGTKFGDGGAMTFSLLGCLMSNPHDTTFGDLFADIHNSLSSRGFDQKPQICTTQKFEASRKFNFNEVCLNSNPVIGRPQKKIRYH
eukprot:GHVP01029707.1.p1 GENE.GHVP01029707.1~~GHVP01029707.1.p1  ORF type:complete len:480 (-),score=67.93 GHVP01029707.1:41-1480(-)